MPEQLAKKNKGIEELILIGQLLGIERLTCAYLLVDGKKIVSGSEIAHD